MSIHLTNIISLKGTIECKTGLRVGTGNLEMRIGGTDAPIIRHPQTNLPYIPGSSLKGKVRSLVEIASGIIGKKNSPKPIDTKVFTNSEDSNKNLSDKEISLAKEILKVFGFGGSSDDSYAKELGPTRCFFSDCYLNQEWHDKVKSQSWLLTEVKMENQINRITGTADNPRSIERVPAGTIFDFQIHFRILQPGDEALIEKILLPGLKLVEMDTLGGYGSRGYGKVIFHFDDASTLNGKKVKDLFQNLNPFQSLSQ